MGITCREHHLDTWMPASLASIDRVCGEVRGFLARLDLDQFFFEISLVVREALVNAVAHGCGSDAKQKVHVSLWIDGQEMILEIEDPGTGFDWKNQIKQSAALTDVHGRGLTIFQHYCTGYEYNQQGNKIRLFKSLAR